jgi:ATP-dependent DNA helicase RecG
VITTSGLAETLGITVKGVEWQIKDLKSRGIIRRIGSKKTGHWEIIEN